MSLVVLIIVFTFIVRVVTVNGDSMLPTMHDGDRLMVSNLFYTPQRGDIVVVMRESADPKPLIKRVIAVEGDVVDIDFEKGIVSVNNEPLDEPYCLEPTYTSMEVVFPQRVPSGHFFVLGDNRNNSLDSRSDKVGMIDTRYLLGKAFLRLLPFNRLGTV